MHNYFIFAISICFISWIVGMIVNAFLRKTAFYENKLSRLNFIGSERINKIIGLHAFKWIVKNTFFKFFNQKLKLANKAEKPDLERLRAEMTISEIDHLIGFCFVMIFAIEKSVRFNIAFGIVIFAVNILMNLYPSLLQQENKRRIDKVLKRLG